MRLSAALIVLASTPNTLAEEKAYAGIESALRSLESARGAASATIGFCLLPADEGAPVVERNGRRSLVPASTVKAITTGVALYALGPDFTFDTVLQRTGPIGEGGTLRGDLVIRGGGDPTLAEFGWRDLFADWTRALTAAGVKKIGGSVVGDASVFGTQQISRAWQWDDIANHYASGSSALSFHMNRYNIVYRPGKTPGATAKYLRSEPTVPGIRLVNEMRTGAAGSGDRGFVYGAPYGELFYLRGTIPKGGSTFTIKAALPDPPLFCAQRFSAHLKSAGIPVTGDATTVRRRLLETSGAPSGKRAVLHTHRSKPLSHIIIHTNWKSVNLKADCILRQIGLKEKGRGTIESGAAAIRSFVKSKGITTEGMHLFDGSGLSRVNAITPRQMTYILRELDRGDQGTALRKALPVAGKSGTLASIGKGTAAEGRIVAKSGTLDRIKCYAGFVNARSGDRYVFAIMVNNYASSYAPIKQGITKVMAAMARL